jgi:hypothetical protein
MKKLYPMRRDPLEADQEGNLSVKEADQRAADPDPEVKEATEAVTVINLVMYSEVVKVAAEVAEAAEAAEAVEVAREEVAREEVATEPQEKELLKWVIATETMIVVLLDITIKRILMTDVLREDMVAITDRVALKVANLMVKKVIKHQETGIISNSSQEETRAMITDLLKDIETMMSNITRDLLADNNLSPDILQEKNMILQNTQEVVVEVEVASEVASVVVTLAVTVEATGPDIAVEEIMAIKTIDNENLEFKVVLHNSINFT